MGLSLFTLFGGEDFGLRFNTTCIDQGKDRILESMCNPGRDSRRPLSHTQPLKILSGCVAEWLTRRKPEWLSGCVADRKKSLSG